MNHFAINSGLFIFRVTMSLYMLLGHGLGKIERILSGGEIKFLDPFGLGAAASLYMAAFAEFLGSIFIIFGIFNRVSNISLMITMAVAVFIAHADDPFSRQEKALMYLVSYIFLLIAGPGKFSLTGIFNKKFSKQNKFVRFLIG